MKHAPEPWQKKTLLILLVEIFLIFTHSIYATTIERNWARGKRTQQSSEAFGGVSSRAVDGNNDGMYSNGSVTHTNSEKTPFWDVDLGVIVPIDFLRIYNRADCCSERLNNILVFISDKPFNHSDPKEMLLEPGVTWNVIWGQAGDAGPHNTKLNIHTLNFPDRAFGRYVRVQLAGEGILSLAEVEVIQMEEIKGPSHIDDGMSWTPTGIVVDRSEFTALDKDGTLVTFQRGADGLLHFTEDFTNDQTVTGSPTLSASVPPAAVYDAVNAIPFVAVVAADGTLQIGEEKSVRTGGARFTKVWVWTTLGNTAKEPALAISCGKVVVAWLEGNTIRTSWKNLVNGTWSSPHALSDGISMPSLATAMDTPYGDFGIAFLRGGGNICFVRAQCSNDLQWGGVETLVGLSFGDRVGLAAYGEYFAMTTIGGDARPYFTLQVQGPNGFPQWPGFERIRAVDFEESKIMEPPRLTIYRGMIYAVARDESQALRFWLREPNHMASKNSVGWCGGSIVGGGGTSSTTPRLVAVGQSQLFELSNVPAELYVITAGVSDRQLYGLNFGRSTSLDLLNIFFHLDLSSNPGNELGLSYVANLPEHVLAILSLPDKTWNGVIGKKCDRLMLATHVFLHPNTAGQARAGNCPMEIYLNGGLQSARFMLHEWMHLDFRVRKIYTWKNFSDIFNADPKICEEQNDCGGDECTWADPFVNVFALTDTNIRRWAGQKVCVDNGRPQGFVTFYDLDGPEHSFIETATRYRWQGDELRFLAARDLQRGNDRLKKKYDWIKDNYYGGQEFNGWSSSGYSSTAGVPAGDRTRGYIGRPLR